MYIEGSNTLLCYPLPENRDIVSSHFNVFCKKEQSLLLDSDLVALHTNEATSNGFATTLAGSTWFIDWDEQTTLKINGFHSETSLSRFCFKYVSPN